MKKHRLLSSREILELSHWIGTTEDAKEVKRAQAIILFNQGQALETITLLTCLKRRQIFHYRSDYLKRGIDGIRNKRKGRPPSLLSKGQREAVISLLSKTTPQDHGYSSAFWSTSLLGHLIREKYGVIYKTKRPFYLLFEEASFSFHKPGNVYEKRDEKKVEAWKEEMIPKIEEAYQDPNTVVLCEDEMILSTQTTFQKVWLKKGEYPKIEVSNTKKNRSIYGFLNIKTGQEHAFMKDWQNMHITVEVLQEIRKIYPLQKIFLVWDGAGWHKGSAVQDFIKKDNNIDSYHFPPYCPEENPQEHVWKAGRSAVTHNKFIPDLEKTAKDFINHLCQKKFPYKLLNFGAVS